MSERVDIWELGVGDFVRTMKTRTMAVVRDSTSP